MELSEDLLFYIIDYFDKEYLLKINTLSRNINKYTNKNKFWYKFYLKSFSQYLFNSSNTIWKTNYLNVSILISNYYKLIRKIMLIQPEQINYYKKYSNLNNINFLKCDKALIRNLDKKKIKTEVWVHRYYGYSIVSTYLTNYDELYFSIYFVNNSESYDLFYKIDKLLINLII